LARDICRWHHERYDGRGYPDGLKGDEIPISAQIVSIADVYDALTSKRVYKDPIPHDEALRMIQDGQCGTFNPLLLECLLDIADTLPADLESYTNDTGSTRRMRAIAEEILRRKSLNSSERTLQLLEYERIKTAFFADMSRETQFEYTLSPSMLTLNAWGAKQLGLPETILDPFHNKALGSILHVEDFRFFTDVLQSTTPEDPVVHYTCRFHINGTERWTELVARSIWSNDDPPRYTGAIGKAVDIHETHVKLTTLEQQASHDPATGLLNRTYASNCIKERMRQRPMGHFALALFDLDNFKDANDTYGHLFGDRVLATVAAKLRQSIRSGDIIARVGGDEFLIFLEYRQDLESAIHRIFDALRGSCEGFRVSVSMGIAQSIVVGTDYDTLFHAADKALYTAKRAGRDTYRFYDNTMQDTLSGISPSAPVAAAAETEP
jgi:putative two-component system response regulator